jgi:hypothetical protein
LNDGFFSKTSHCLFLITGQSQRLLGESIESVVRERRLKNCTSCIYSNISAHLLINTPAAWFPRKIIIDEKENFDEKKNFLTEKCFPLTNVSQLKNCIKMQKKVLHEHCKRSPQNIFDVKDTLSRL